MHRVHYALWGILLIGLLALGCSKGGGTPVTPGVVVEKPTTYTSNQQLLLGLYDISIDPVNLVAEVVPIRGPAFQVNIVQYLQPPLGNPANLGLKINPAGTNPAEGIFDLDISITHPFPGSNLRGFDVRAIVMGKKATQLSQFDYDIQFPKPDELRLLNADGYTRWWNAVEFLTPGLFGFTETAMGIGKVKGTMNGYKYYSDGLGASDPLDLDIENRGTFSTEDGAGDPNVLTRQFIIRFPMDSGVPQIQFQYAICASFLPPDPGNPPPAPVDAYPIEANCPEPYKIDISVDPDSTAYYTSVSSGGDLILNIEVFDWQALENPKGVPAEIGAFRIESPTLWTGLIDPVASGTPYPTTNPTSSAWQVEIKNVTPTAEEQDIFVTVQSADPTSYAPPIPGAGIYPGGGVLAAYFLHTVELPGNSAPIIGEISGPSKYGPGALLVYNLSSMTDLQDGTNLTVTWDFDGDGIFEDDDDGSDTNKKGSYTFLGPGDYTVQCRVTDTQDAYTDSNTLVVEPLSFPYVDPMDGSTESLWHVENGFNDIHVPALEWNVQGDHWSTSSSVTGYYDDDMNTMLISPVIPAGANPDVHVTLTHRYNTESTLDDCQAWYRLNGGSWMTISPQWSAASLGYPSYIDSEFSIPGLAPGDLIELGFLFDTDYSIVYAGWDITHLTMIDNTAPVIDGIYGPQSVDSLGPVTYSTVANDLDGIALYLWSLEPAGDPPVYDDPGDGMGSLEAYFANDGQWELYVEATDAGDPPLSSTFGPYGVTVFFKNPDAFFSDDFDTDTGAWTYTGGVGDGAYQDFWHIETGNSLISNVGPDGCYASESVPPIPKSASVGVSFPTSGFNAMLKLLHSMDTEDSGFAEPYDGQWVEIDGTLIEPYFGFTYQDNGGLWPHGYFVGNSGGYSISIFDLGTIYNDGLTHTLTLHCYSVDMATNCLGGWQIDYLEFWIED